MRECTVSGVHHTAPRGCLGHRAVLPMLLAAWLAYFLCAPPLSAATLDEAETLFYTGDYAKCIDAATEEIERSSWQEAWHELKIRAELAAGRNADALKTLDAALADFTTSVRLRLLGHRVCLFNNQLDQAEKYLDEIQELATEQPSRYTDRASQVALGQFFLLRRVDAKLVLETFFDPVRENRPDYADVYLATGQLALEKSDDRLAAESFREAVKLRPADPEGHFGLARAYAAGSPDRAAESLRQALVLNPHHAGSLLLLADRMIDSENYAEAEEVLAKVLATNGTNPEAWAYRAVMAHLANDPAGEKACRDKALATWSKNPRVDHLLGKKLSLKYRFAEAAEYQRQALRFDPTYVPAKIALSQDLLRLGQEEEGWRLADEVYEDDGYNIVAHNLVTLRDTMAQYTTLEGDGFVLRMDAREADIYGRDAIDLLRRAREALCARYDVTLDGPIVVEIFAEQKDFAVRTFGIPEGDGFLGVCFGNVITANSPASQGATPSNWQAVLWHELCHAVTLRKTGNKMPRWLSEGLSVYEERRADPSWGERMNAQYREMLLADDLTPVSQLSAAFLSPSSMLDLQFAYFESSLVVEYLFEKYGDETIRQVLSDLGQGMTIEEALGRHVGPAETLDKEFAQYARQRAEQYGPKADWTVPDLPEGSGVAELTEWLKDHPDNIMGLSVWAEALIDQEQWAEAKGPLETITRLCPDQTGADNAFLLLARVHRELGETEAEREALEKAAAHNDDAVSVYMRLTEICQEAGDWDGMAEFSERTLAVNPLIPAPHRSLADAAERLGNPGRAISSYRALLRMDPRDPAEAHYRLARLLQQAGELREARRHVLIALEEAPRYRAALGTLLEIVEQDPAPTETPEEAP